MVGDDDDPVPEVIAVRVWARREVGECCTDIAGWLERIGYAVSPSEVERIAGRHAQRLEAAWAQWAGRGHDASGHRHLSE
jgi:hypothetical protein